MKLEIGAGKRPTPGYTHLDIISWEDIEIVADARRIPLPDESCEEVYSHWVFEHFTYLELVGVLSEWRRVLKPKGVLRIVTSNQSAINKALDDDELDWFEWNRLTFGEHPNNYENCHKVGFSPGFLSDKLIEAGFKDVKLEAAWPCKEPDGSLKCPGLIATACKL